MDINLNSGSNINPFGRLDGDIAPYRMEGASVARRDGDIAPYRMEGASVARRDGDIAPYRTDTAGIDGIKEISEKELDRNDDLGMLFARAFGSSIPVMPDFPDT